MKKNLLSPYHDYIVKLYQENFPEEAKLVRSITFQVTEDCCFNCSYCYQINKSKKTMSKEIAQQGVDLLFKMWDENKEDGFINQNTKALILEFIGGEPFLNIDIVDYITRYFIDQCLIRDHPWLQTFRISISSNGDLYFNEKVQKYIKDFNKFLSISITIDGPKELHNTCRVYPNGEGTFDKAYSALKHYQNTYNNEPGTKVTIAPENMREINNIIKFFINENIYEIFANVIFEHKWSAEEAQIFYQELKMIADYILTSNLQDKIYISLFDDYIGHTLTDNDNQNWCGGTMDMLAFDPDGIAYPCIRYMASSLGKDIEPLSVGDVTGLFKTNKEKEIADYMFSITRRSQSTDECYYCPVASGCAWCSGWNYQENGDVNIRSTNICLAHKARVLANVYYWNKFYKLNQINEKFDLNLAEEEALQIISKEEYEMLKELSL